MIQIESQDNHTTIINPKFITIMETWTSDDSRFNLKIGLITGNSEISFANKEDRDNLLNQLINNKFRKIGL